MNNSSQGFGHNTPDRKSLPTTVTVTHPHHPLFEQRLELVKLRKGAQPKVVIRLPEGKTAYLPIEYTDYASTVTPDVNRNDDTGGENLLDLEGLLRAVNLVNELKKRR